MRLIGGDYNGAEIETSAQTGELIHITDHWTPLLGPAVYRVVGDGTAVSLVTMHGGEKYTVHRREELKW